MHLFLEMLGKIFACCISIKEDTDIFRVETKLSIFPGLPHGFILAVNMEFSSRYFRNMVEWVDKRLKIGERSSSSNQAGSTPGLLEAKHEGYAGFE